MITEAQRKAHVKWRKKNHTHSKEYMRAYQSIRNNDPKKYFAITVRGCVKRAAKRKVPCDITVNDLVNLLEQQEYKCVLTGRIMILNSTGGRHPNRVSVDRIDQTKGYILSNIRLICFWVNMARSEWSDDALIDWCKAVVDHSTARSPNIT